MRQPINYAGFFSCSTIIKQSLLLLTLTLFSSVVWSAIVLSSNTTANTGNVTLYWSSDRQNQFFIYENGKQVGTGAQTTFSLSNKSPGTYIYRVEGCNSYGCAYPSYYRISNNLTVTINGGSGESNAQQRQTLYRYDALGRLILVDDYDNGLRDYDFDKAGNRTSVGNN